MTNKLKLEKKNFVIKLVSMTKEIKLLPFFRKVDKKAYFSEYFLSSINFNGMTEKLIKERPGMPLRVAKAVTLATVYALHADLVIEECKKEERFEDIIDEDVLYEENQ